MSAFLLQPFLILVFTLLSRRVGLLRGLVGDRVSRARTSEVLTGGKKEEKKDKQTVWMLGDIPSLLLPSWDHLLSPELRLHSASAWLWKPANRFLFFLLFFVTNRALWCLNQTYNLLRRPTQEITTISMLLLVQHCELRRFLKKRNKDFLRQSWFAGLFLSKHWIHLVWNHSHYFSCTLQCCFVNIVSRPM